MSGEWVEAVGGVKHEARLRRARLTCGALIAAGGPVIRDARRLDPSG